MISLFGVFGIIIYILIGWNSGKKAERKALEKLKDQYVDAVKCRGKIKAVEKEFIRTMHVVEFEYQGELLERKAIDLKKYGYNYNIGDEVDVFYDGKSLTDCAYTDYSDVNID
ncbi:hypothetical protein [Fusobacterium sp. PH5-44]|uniref:hypothetical protein n=1 Tax=unclassified Fusobacterium TaxID=2648384 RepID=UPI003D21762D